MAIIIDQPDPYLVVVVEGVEERGRGQVVKYDPFLIDLVRWETNGSSTQAAKTLQELAKENPAVYGEYRKISRQAIDGQAGITMSHPETNLQVAHITSGVKFVSVMPGIPLSEEYEYRLVNEPSYRLEPWKSGADK